MFVVSKRNIILPGPDGKKFRMSREYMGEVPGWAAKSDYFKALVKDGKVIVSGSRKDKDVQKAEDPPSTPSGEDQ